MRKIYAFDFDGTLTTKDTLLEFIHFARGIFGLWLGLLRYAHLLVMMMMGLYPNWKAKQKVFAYFFEGMRLEDFNTLCQEFAASSSHLLRPEGIEAINQAVSDGAEVLIVSASIDNWVQPFFAEQSGEAERFPDVQVLGTQVEVKEGILTGKFLTQNCYGQEKVNRIQALYPNRQDYHLTAYGDSRGDKELLAFADQSYFKPFREPNPFKIKPTEKIQAIIVLILIILLNLVLISKYPHFVSIMPDNFKEFIHQFKVSGYDPITYSTLTNWYQGYNVYRHPLLAFMMWIPYLLNTWLIELTGLNLVQYLVGLLLVFCGFYSYIFMRRILVEVIGLKETDGIILNAMFFGFAFTMVALVVPDHFVISQMLLLLTLYLCGISINRKRHLSIWHTIILFVITAGVTLSNGVKIYLAALFTNKWRFFRPKYLLLAVIIPPALMWMFCRWEYQTYVLPNEKAVEAQKKAQRRADIEKFTKLYAEQSGEKDSARIAEGGRKLYRKHVWEVHEKNMKDPWNAHTGEPIAKEGFMKWTDVSTDRWETAVHNLFGETIQLHQDYLLDDTLKSRPVVVEYRYIINYVVEALIVGLFLIGIWMGRRQRLLWLVLSCLAFDMALHLGLGFGINEVYIMGPHWLFVIPISIAYIFKNANTKWLLPLRVVTTLLAIFLLGWNGWLFINC